MGRWPRAPRRSSYQEGFYSFISYSTRDDEISQIKPVVDEYCEALRLRIKYVPIFYDGYYIPNGHPNLLQYLAEQIHKSDFTTALLSPGYASSAWCGFEWWESYRMSQSRRCPRCGTVPILQVVWKNFENRQMRSVFSCLDESPIDIINEIENKNYEHAVDKLVDGTMRFLDKAYGRT